MPPAFVPWSPAAMPATCVAWNDCVGSNGSVRVLLRRRRRARTSAARSPSASCTASAPSGTRAGTVKPARVEVRVGRVEAVVDDPDLHPVAGGREVRRPRACRRRSARARRIVAQRVVADVRPDAVDARDVRERARAASAAGRPRSRSRRAVAPADLARRAAPTGCARRARPARPHAQAVGGVAARLQRPSERRERRRLERDDHLGRGRGLTRAENVPGERRRRLSPPR